MITPYQRGFAFGCSLAREVLDPGDRGARRYNAGDMPDTTPMLRRDRAAWLNGLSAGIKHVAFNQEMSRTADGGDDRDGRTS